MQENQNEQQVAGIKYGVFNAPNAPIVGKSIAEVREQFGRKFEIPDDATAFNGKQKIDNDYVVKEGDQIQFSRASGEKGRA